MAKIIGNTITTPYPHPDWEQTDSTKADYIKNKPTILTEEDVAELIAENGGGSEAINQIQSDWNQTNESAVDYIKNKPDIRDVLRCTAQDLTEEQKTQVRLNIGAGDSGFSGSYNDLTDKPDIPSVNGLATEGYVDEKVAKLVDAAPDLLNTLNELAGALGNDANFATTVATQIGEKANQTALDSIDARVLALEAQIGDMVYEPISITSFSHNVKDQERGTTVTNVTLSWEINKTPTILTLDGESISVDLTSHTVDNLSITWNNNKIWTLTAIDSAGNKSTKTTSITFANGIYYGASTMPNEYNSNFILGLTKKLRNNKLSSFTVDAGENQYIYYCLPTRLGECTFSVGGFTGGFTLSDTISFTNASGYTEDYYIYRSDKANLGSTTVNIA